MSRFVMLVAAACFAGGTLVSAQGRGNGPAGRGPQTVRGGSGGPTVKGGGGGGRQSGGVTPRNAGGRAGNPGTARGNRGGGGNADNSGRGGNAGNPGGGNADNPGRGGNAGNAGGSNGDNPGRDGNAGNAGRGGNADNPGRGGNGGNAGNRGRGGNAEDDQAAPGGGRGRDGAGRQTASLVANMNPQLRARLEAMLPSGMTLEQAAEGFRNRGQFIAALQQSNNHDIPFPDLKAQMTGDNPLSLGEAMRKLGVATDED